MIHLLYTQCNSSCDACKSPKSLKDALRAHKLCMSISASKKSLAGTMLANFEYGVKDSSLYEGGKWGDRELVTHIHVYM